MHRFRKSPRLQNHWKCVIYLTLIVLILRQYADEEKWRANSKWATLVSSYWDCMTSWVVLRHPGDGHLGWFLWSGAADRDGGDASYWLKQLSKGSRLLNMLLASGVHRLRSCWRRTFWEHAAINMMWCDTYDFLRDNNCYSWLSLFI